MNSVKPREKRHKRDNQFTDIGVRGRKTGVLIRKNILQDEDGLDNVDDFFASSSEDEQLPTKLNTQSQNIDMERSELETTFEESADMELSVGSGVSPAAYLDQSSVISINSNRSENTPVPKSVTRNVYSAKRTRHIFEESMESPDIGAINRKSASKITASPIRKPMISSTPNSSSRKNNQRSKYQSRRVESPAEQEYSMEEATIPDADDSMPMLEPSPMDRDTELDSVLDNSSLSASPLSNRGSRSIPQELNEEVDEVLSENDMNESLEQSSPLYSKPSPKKAVSSGRASGDAKKKPAPKQAAPKQVIKKVSPRILSEEEGVRRSGRTRVKPLDYWRNERIVYGRRKSGQNVVPVVKEIVTVPEEQFLHPKKAKRRPAAKKGRRIDVEEDDDDDIYDDKPIEEITVRDWYTGEDVKQAIGLTKDMVSTKPVKNQSFEFEKTFGEAAFMSSGIIKIHVNGKKPKRNSYDNAMVFYVISGSCRVTIHESSFIISTGGQFHVPRGNQYQLENIGANELRLFFAQARETVPEE
ncbi:hypothetical protein K493DRAFT_19557 [Basidiobolus meristosporus CBS 931.73]|uniref:CENP-C homolog n=1 Tax=Basidiobolus meristosporus CBS 931.73 TaxID=1314790 RepID=A0A1Y1YFK4_9FUNG|nr:hypothetical protein K493DRAFT_19557 [Basidiobolus meristosporus CBS 931.73]|eukprot:ORX96486.1 hypothetical protein K493DRAFT_19557 [Basidiobolus meristosporus CBS 931.73]